MFRLVSFMNMSIFLAYLIWSFVLGSIAGSFANVVMYRVPRKESVFLTRSHCPVCKKTLKWRDLIPLVSYVFLQGKCRNCEVGIPFRYFLVELIFGVSFFFGFLVLVSYGFI